MRRASVALAALVLIGWFSSARSAVQAPDELPAKISAFIHQPSYQQARWGILIVDAESGQPLFQHNPDQLFLPASTTKLYSCAAALATLGPDFRFEPPVYARGKQVNGRLTGDLILVAKGDVTIGGRNNADGTMAFRNHEHIYARFA